MKKLQPLTDIIDSALDAILQATVAGSGLSIEEALRQSCAKAGGITPEDIAATARAIVLAKHGLTLDDDAECFDSLAYMIQAPDDGRVATEKYACASKTWRTLAAELGNARAQFMLGKMAHERTRNQLPLAVTHINLHPPTQPVT